MKKLSDIQWLFVAFGFVIVIFIVVVLWQDSRPTSVSAASFARNDMVINEPIQPIPLDITVDKAKAALGKRLFNEPMFSGDNTISCATCHVLSSGGVDHLRYPHGVSGAIGTINTPTVFNSGLNFRQFWDGRAATLEKQVPGPIHNPIEMGSNWSEVVRKLTATPDYVSAFQGLYSDGITPDNIADAVATFERTLTTPNSRFDQYLRGNNNAITPDELKGYNLFKAYGCVSCHQGANVGGNIYQYMGIVSNYFRDRGNITQADYGAFNVTGDEQDRFKFKVPSLRMAAFTAPYFHDGSVPTLDAAVKKMAHYQLGRELSSEEIRLIVAFIKTLPGDNVEFTPAETPNP